MVMKTCKKCGIKKPLTEFYKDTTGKHGVRGECKLCKILKPISGNKFTYATVWPITVFTGLQNVNNTII